MLCEQGVSLQDLKKAISSVDETYVAVEVPNGQRRPEAVAATHLDL
jgi:hypothetical protein